MSFYQRLAKLESELNPPPDRMRDPEYIFNLYLDALKNRLFPFPPPGSYDAQATARLWVNEGLSLTCGQFITPDGSRRTSQELNASESGRKHL